MSKRDLLTRVSGMIGAAVIVLLAAGSALGARPVGSTDVIAVPNLATVRQVERVANGRLLAIGRVDRLSRQKLTVSLLGQEFLLLATRENRRFVSEVSIGRPVALFGEISGGSYLVDAAMRLDGQYVQGASKVYLKGRVHSNNRGIGALALGQSVTLDTSALISRGVADRLSKGSVASVIGTQPTIGGRVLVEAIRKDSVASIDASLGTGRSDASLGTGRSEASLGTGRSEASLGTGRSEASLGTGRSDASLGTG
jgi:hypothetical protein